ncbi:MAG: ATP-grasp domain-containing protein [Deltaproteobacteria bacterium]|nr:ATP-grasp domain-containing protein [Deltaproteobacteria bacterium]
MRWRGTAGFWPSFFHRRLRELPPSGGISVLSEAIPPDPEAARAGRALLEALHWTGPAMVEFKRDADGRPCLMEINGRFWGSLQLAIDAGVDFPALLVRAAQGDAIVPPDYKSGTRLRYLFGDLESLALVLVRGSAALPPGTGGRGAYVRGFLRERGRLELCRSGDKAPAFFDARRFTKKTVQIIMHKIFPRTIEGAVHGHTDYSYDGVLTPEQLALHLAPQGLRFFAITEHENSMHADKLADLAARCDEASRTGFRLIPGVEFATKRGTHILGLGVREFFDEHDPVKIVRGIRERGGVAVLAHPDNGDFERDPAFLRGLHGVELWNSVHDGPFRALLQKRRRAARDSRGQSENSRFRRFGFSPARPIPRRAAQGALGDERSRGGSRRVARGPVCDERPALPVRRAPSNNQGGPHLSLYRAPCH